MKSIDLFCIHIDIYGYNIYGGKMKQFSEKNDIKVFILYLLRNIGYPLELSNINDVVLHDDMVGYFDFAECFPELIDTGNVAKITENGVTLYEKTEQGKMVADNLETEIRPYIMERSLKSAMRFLDFQKKGWKTDCDYRALPNGKYEFSCFVLEHKAEIMRITVTVDSKNTLEKMVYNFGRNPETVFKGLMSVLTGEINYLL
jgi:hypothetical protein